MSSRITIKKNLIIFHHPGDWIEIYQKILHEYGIGMAVRTKLRRELGFTYRHHRGLVRNDIFVLGEPDMHYEDQIHVDFYNQSAQSWFQLKYLNL
jgi:hypothetical protein